MYSLSRDDFDTWRARYITERQRLAAALGWITEGGVIENVSHIGATSVPGLPARPCVDIGLAAWPFPLAPAALDGLGYTALADTDTQDMQRFRRADEAVELWVAEAGSRRWTDWLLVADYLRHDEDARLAVAAEKEAAWRSGEAVYQAATDSMFQRLLPDAHRWSVAHHGFGPVEVVAREMADLGCAWAVASGWALDLFLGRVTRVHHDVDVEVARADQLVVRDYLTERGWRFVTPFAGRLEPWPLATRLEPPRHQIHAHRDGAFIDVLLTENDAHLWRYRRQPDIVRSPTRAILASATGVPYLAPELVLLYKSRNTGRHPRPQDQADFHAAVAHLEPERRAWLAWALMATQPDHEWLAQLG